MFFITNLRIKLLFIYSLLIFGSSGSLFGQLEVVADKATAIYETNETMNFLVSSDQTGDVHYVIRRDRYTPILAEGDINIVDNNPVPVPFSLSEPGAVICWVYQNGNYNTAGAVYDPFNIQLDEDDPADLLTFWDDQFATLSTIPLDPQITFHSDDDYSSTYRVNLANVDGRRVYGYISVPNGTGPFPAVLRLPAFGSSANLATTEEIMATRGGVLAMSISIHNVEPDEEDPLSYEPDVITNRDSMYYRYAVLGAVRAIDYIFTRTDFDGVNLGVNGVSQGGGLSMLVAGLDNRVKALAQSNAALCDADAFKYEKSSGFPYYLRQSDDQVGTIEHLNQTSFTAKYFDAARLAKYVTAPSLSLIGYEDTICPPASTYAAFNRLPGPKVLSQGREVGHVHPYEYTSGRFDFFRYQFPTMLDLAPWPWPDSTNGYFIDAGPNFDIPETETAMLSGYSQLNDVVHESLPVSWRKISGPGSVSFGNANASNTTVVFDAPGTYVLEYKVVDPYDAEEAKTYTLIDYVEVIVIEDTTDAVSSSETDFVLNILPNPSNGFFQIHAFDERIYNAQIKIFNVNGLALSEVELDRSNSHLNIDLSSHPTGVYFIHLELPDGVRFVQKVLKI